MRTCVRVVNRGDEEAIASVKINVARPIIRLRYDLILDLGSRLLRVQCKWAHSRVARSFERIALQLLHARAGYVRSNYGADEIDAIGLYCGRSTGCYLIPVDAVEGRSHASSAARADG